jgi:HAD superfamily hydrolase (TIGR01484 family)
MRFLALATDYDGTLAEGGLVDRQTVEALRRLRQTGRRVILVTGRTVAGLREVFPSLSEFDSIVAENGATLFDPATGSERPLADAPPEAFMSVLQQRVSLPLEIGRAIVATSESEKQTVLDTIQELGLDLQIIFNKGSLMILPSGVNKATGLMAALKELGLSVRNVAGIGDAENDHAFLAVCEFSAAVANALPTVKERVQLVTNHGPGRGVIELVEEVVANDLAGHTRRLGQPVVIGRAVQGDVSAAACGINMMIGASGGGKSLLTTALLESLCSMGYQFCVIDPEGDYELFPDAVTLGHAKHVPAVDEVVKAMNQPGQNVIVNLLGLKLEERPKTLESVFLGLQELRSRTGRPHCLIIDEAHHFLGPDRRELESKIDAYTDDAASGLVLVTVNPDQLPSAVLAKVQFLAIAGEDRRGSLRAFCSHAGLPCPETGDLPLQPGQMIGWQPGKGDPFHFSGIPAKSVRVRHRRKYAEGELAPERSFYFRGPDRKLNLRAHNLIMFLNLMSGVDDATWLFHLRNGDYSAWFRREIKDEDLAQQAAALENSTELSPEEGRRKLYAIVTERYTLPA